ncbi:MAG: diguanylate cyclase [Clostridium sp.]|nr:diguanylate cyclase [Clostridium sp.]
MSYSVIGLLASGILLIENQDILLGKNKMYEQNAWKTYRAFLFAVLGYYLTDVLWGVADFERLWWPMFLDTSLYFIAMAAGVLLLTKYIVIYLDQEKSQGWLFVLAGRLIATLVVLLTAVNCFNPVLFFIDPDGRYYPMQGRYVILSLQILLMIMISAYAFSAIIHHGDEPKNRRRYRTLGLFGMTMGICLFLQVLDPFLPFYSVGYMLGTCLLRAVIIEDEKAELHRRLETEYEKARSANTSYSHITKALAHGYMTLVYVNLENGKFIEYQTDMENAIPVEKVYDKDFFTESRRIIEKYVHPDDRSMMEQAVSPEQLQKEQTGRILTCRLMEGKGPTYVSMKISRMDDENSIVIGVTDIDGQVQERRILERMKEEKIIYGRIHALTGDFLCIWIISPDKGYYREYSTSELFATLGLPKDGKDFFNNTRDLAYTYIYPEDQNRFLKNFTRERVLNEIEKNGIFTMSYRMIIEDKTVHVQLKAAIQNEEDGPRLMVGISNIEDQVRRENEYAEHLAKAQHEALLDALTGVRNKHAYLETEKQINQQIKDGSVQPFALVILDVNDLKKVNDEQGHQAGDQYLRDACRIICDIFKHSPVFRIGGDEFAVIAQGPDYDDIETLVGKMNDHNAEAVYSGDIVVACGMSKYAQDDLAASIFKRADENMYDNKKELKKKRSEADG